MSDRERVIYDIEQCICHVPDACRNCSKYKGAYTPNCMEQLLADALELLKKQESEWLEDSDPGQEAVEPREQEETRTWIVCGNCSQHLISKWLYCPYCGRKVKWE